MDLCERSLAQSSLHAEFGPYDLTKILACPTRLVPQLGPSGLVCSLSRRPKGVKALIVRMRELPDVGSAADGEVNVCVLQCGVRHPQVLNRVNFLTAAGLLVQLVKHLPE